MKMKEVEGGGEIYYVGLQQVHVTIGSYDKRWHFTTQGLVKTGTCYSMNELQKIGTYNRDFLPVYISYLLQPGLLTTVTLTAVTDYIRDLLHKGRVSTET